MAPVVFRGTVQGDRGKKRKRDWFGSIDGDAVYAKTAVDMSEDAHF